MALDKYIPGSMQGVQPNPLVIDITYAELVDKISLSALIPGQKYRITDYRTAYNMPNVTPAEKIVCTVEPLLVTANSVNTLSMYAYSEAFPQDEIYYNPTNDQAMVAGCDMGYIYRRVDKLKSIDVGFDWRNVKFRRWKVAVSDIYDVGTTYAKGAVVKDPASNDLYVSTVSGNVGNILWGTGNDSDRWLKLGVSNGTYVSPEAVRIATGYYDMLTIPCSSDFIDLYLFSTTADVGSVQSDYSSISGIFIKQNSSAIISNANTVFVGSHYNWNINGLCYNNTIGGTSHDNYVEGEFSYNLISLAGGFNFNKFSKTTKCIFANAIDLNNFGGWCHANLIATNFSENNFRGNVANCYFNYYIIKNTSNFAIDTLVLPMQAKFNIFNCNVSSVSCPLSNVLEGENTKIWNKSASGEVLVRIYTGANSKEVIYSPTTDTYKETKEYTALLSETGYSATSGLLIAGQTYYIASYVAGDDFTNVGGTNVTGNTFVASGTTPTAWTNSSILVSVGISAPAVTLLTNGLSGAIVWTYSAVGTYIGTLSGAFTENKTVFSYPPLGDDKAVTVEWTSANVITVKTYETGALKDGLLVKFPLTIKVYP